MHHPSSHLEHPAGHTKLGGDIGGAAGTTPAAGASVGTSEAGGPTGEIHGDGIEQIYTGKALETANAAGARSTNVPWRLHRSHCRTDLSSQSNIDRSRSQSCRKRRGTRCHCTNPEDCKSTFRCSEGPSIVAFRKHNRGRNCSIHAHSRRQCYSTSRWASTTASWSPVSRSSGDLYKHIRIRQ